MFPTVEVRQPGHSVVYLSVRGPIELGRECTGLLLGDPQVSRRHLRLSPAGLNQVTVEDLGSTNGTFVDGQRLGSPHTVGANSSVRAGDTEIAVVAAATTEPVRPANTTAGADLRRTSIEIVADEASRSGVDLSKVDTDRGTVTIVFSDIESSTERNIELGDGVWFEMLNEHNRIVERRVNDAGGTVVKNQGDGFMLSFPGARRALDCMAAVQRDLRAYSQNHPGRGLLVRVGLHTGEVIAADDGDLFGQHVVLAARVANLAEGGEILVSSLTREIVVARGDIDLSNGREVDLKGIGPALVYRFDWA